MAWYCGDSENAFLSYTKVIKSLFSELSFDFTPCIVVSEFRLLKVCFWPGSSNFRRSCLNCLFVWCFRLSLSCAAAQYTYICISFFLGFWWSIISIETLNWWTSFCWRFITVDDVNRKTDGTACFTRVFPQQPGAFLISSLLKWYSYITLF